LRAIVPPGTALELAGQVLSGANGSEEVLFQEKPTSVNEKTNEAVAPAT
jgi:hypothetical protein